MKNADVVEKDMPQGPARAGVRRQIPPHANARRGAHRTLVRRAACAIALWFVVLALIVPLAAPARAQSDNSWPRIDCKPSFVKVVVCYNGWIPPNLDLSSYRNLKSGDFFAMRSEGGDARVAMQLADILRDRGVTVRLFDYCLGVCADYIFAASRTLVQRDTIVAWNGAMDTLYGQISKPWCQAAPPREQEPRKLFDRNGVPLKAPMDSFGCERAELNKTFFQERGLDERFIHNPQTDYTRKAIESAWAKHTDRNKIHWMWNPKNYGDAFKSRVQFESYPRSQREVDGIVAKWKTGDRVVFDP